MSLRGGHFLQSKVSRCMDATQQARKHPIEALIRHLSIPRDSSMYGSYDHNGREHRYGMKSPPPPYLACFGGGYGVVRRGGTESGT